MAHTDKIIAFPQSRVIHIPSLRETTIERVGKVRAEEPLSDDVLAELTRSVEEMYGSRPPLFERIADALQSRDFLLVYVGIYIGAAITVAAAAVWSRFL